VAHATVANLLERYDWRTIGDLVSDTDSQVDQGDLATDTNVLTALLDAQGTVESALQVGGRYSAANLSGLTGSSEALLHRLECHLAYTFILERRGGIAEDRFEARNEWVKAQLKDLKSGVNVFGLAEHITAGKPKLEAMTPRSVELASGFRDLTKNYFPHRTYSRTN
jgi:phage gp36-like protein